MDLLAKFSQVATLVALGLVGCSFPPLVDIGTDGGTTADGGSTPGECTPTCSNDFARSCTDGTSEMVSCRGFGCWDSVAGDAAETGDRCADLRPSNGLADYLDMTATAPVMELVDGATINTDTGVIISNGQTVTAPSFRVTQSGTTIEIRVFVARRVRLGSTSVSGTRALAIVADDPIQIDGLLSAAAGSGGVGATTDPVRCTASPGVSGGASGFGTGGGGGGYGTRGGAGGATPSRAGGFGGDVIDTELEPLLGGCPGAHGSVGNDYTSGGHGGGAIQLVSRTSVSVEANGTRVGKVHVGGGGGGLNDDVQRSLDGGGGGGSGGGVLLEAPVVVVSGATVVIAANGGGGGAGGACTGNGFGQNANPSAMIARGGQGCTVASNFVGQFGDGGSGAIAATGGRAGTAPALGAGDYGAAGGGGGGLGILVVRNSNGAFNSQDGAVVSAQLKQLKLKTRARR